MNKKIEFLNLKKLLFQKMNLMDDNLLCPSSYDKQSDQINDYLSSYLNDDIKKDTKKIKNRESQKKSRDKMKQKKESDHILLCNIASDLKEIKCSYANIENKLKLLENVFSNSLNLNTSNTAQINQLQSSLFKINVNCANSERECRKDIVKIINTIDAIQKRMPHISCDYDMYVQDSLTSCLLNTPQTHSSTLNYTQSH